MKMIKSMCLIMTVVTAPSLYAQTDSTNQNQPYGDNPNIFRVLANKTGEAIQNTAEKVGEVTEKGIQKIKPSLDSTIENTKSYTTEQAIIARDNTRQGIDTAVKTVEQTKDKITGKNSYNVPIESGSLSQSSTSTNSNYNSNMVQSPQVAQPIQQIPLNQATQSQTQNNVQNEQSETEIKTQSLPLDNPANSQSAPPENASNSNPISSAKDSSDDNSGVPR